MRVALFVGAVLIDADHECVKINTGLFAGSRLAVGCALGVAAAAVHTIVQILALAAAAAQTRRLLVAAVGVNAQKRFIICNSACANGLETILQRFQLLLRVQRALTDAARLAVGVATIYITSTNLRAAERADGRRCAFAAFTQLVGCARWVAAFVDATAALANGIACAHGVAFGRGHFAQPEFAGLAGFASHRCAPRQTFVGAERAGSRGWVADQALDQVDRGAFTRAIAIAVAAHEVGRATFEENPLATTADLHVAAAAFVGLRHARAAVARAAIDHFGIACDFAIAHADRIERVGVAVRLVFAGRVACVFVAKGNVAGDA